LLKKRFIKKAAPRRRLTNLSEPSLETAS